MKFLLVLSLQLTLACADPSHEVLSPATPEPVSAKSDLLTSKVVDTLPFKVKLVLTNPNNLLFMDNVNDKDNDLDDIEEKI